MKGHTIITKYTQIMEKRNVSFREIIISKTLQRKLEVRA
jgi:hypothetical protein